MKKAIKVELKENEGWMDIPQLSFTFVEKGKKTRLVCRPPGCDFRILPLYERHQEKDGWLWNGDKDEPTLDPSIKVLSTIDLEIVLWHGYLVNGIWQLNNSGSEFE